MSKPRTVRGCAAHEPKAPLASYEYTIPALKASQVGVKITHCGICQSDIHLMDDDWKMSQFPQVCGHEIIGVVEELGPEVKHLRAGQRLVWRV